MIKVEAIYGVQSKVKKDPKFEWFKATIGEKVFYPVPIGFLRISELPKLQAMLQAAYDLGKDDAEIAAAEDAAGEWI